MDNTADGALGNPVSWASTNRGMISDGSTGINRFGDQSVTYGTGSTTNIGYANSFFGFGAGVAITTGRRNAAFGIYALTNVTVGYENIGVGAHAGQNLTTQRFNILIGSYAGFSAGLGGGSEYNVLVGSQAGYGTASGLGSLCVGLGYYALRNINTADSVVAIGAYAGQFANASRQMFIDTGGATRANIAAQQNDGLIYGKAEATVGAQVLNLNAPTRLGSSSGATVASLPAASGNGGRHAYVTDASVAYTGANIGTTVAGGGANTVPVFCNGTNWVIG